MWFRMVFEIVQRPIVIVNFVSTLSFEPRPNILCGCTQMRGLSKQRIWFGIGILATLPLDLLAVAFTSPNVNPRTGCPDLHDKTFLLGTYFSTLRLLKIGWVPNLFAIIHPAQLSQSALFFQLTVLPMLNIFFWLAIAVTLLAAMWLALPDEAGIPIIETSGWRNSLYFVLMTVTSVGYHLRRVT